MSNQFTPLLNLNEDVEGSRHPSNGNCNKVMSNSMVKNDKRKFVIIGDSLARNFAAGLQRQLGRKCTVTGYVKPGAGMKLIVQSGKEEIEKLHGADVVVVWGGSNDISKQNCQEALRQLSKFAEKCQDVNMIVMLAPQRHDLMPSSCVNSEVFRFNRLLRKRMKLYTKTKILGTDLNRDCFTKHGLHMNFLGKDQLIMKLAGMIESVTVKNSGHSIELQWKGTGINLGNMETNQVSRLGGEKQASKYEEGEVNKPQLYKRQRRNPALKDQDFLWQM